MSGQINRGTLEGEFIYNLCKKQENKTIVEIGTWNGAGSTVCIFDALLEKMDDSSLISLEISNDMFKEAQKFWEKKLLNINSVLQEKIKLVHGSILTPSDLPKLEDLKKVDIYKTPWDFWYSQDIDNIKSCPNVLNLIPQIIDVLVLDGGEFSTEAEFNKIGDRAKYIVLDDTKVFKCRSIRNKLLNDFKYELIVDYNHRNGFSAFRRIS